MYVAVYARDLPGSAAARKAALAEHRAHLDTASDGIAIHVSGPLMEDGRMCGSLFLCEAADVASVRAFAARDPMVRAGVYASIEVHAFDWRRGAPA